MLQYASQNQHDRPILIRDSTEVYIVPERVIPGHWIDNSDTESSIDVMEMASMANTVPTTASGMAICKKDPTIGEIGDPCDLGNYLPDSGATQHMTPHRADLFDVVEGQNLGVEVTDGHVIKCSVTGKIQLKMTDDNGNILEAVLNDVMYVPGLSRRLFSITPFAMHGHFAAIQNGSTTLYFGRQQSPVTLTYEGGKAMAADVTVVSSEGQPHLVPCNRNHDHSANKRRTCLELLHQCLGHRKCRAILAASEHGVWADTMVCMGTEDECISCDVSTAWASSRNKEAHTSGNYPGEYVFLDILHPVVPVGLTKDSSFSFYLILVDTYS